jgi:hypothetical protein
MLTTSPPSSNVSNALTDKATSKPPRPDTTAGSGSSDTPGVDGWVISWGLTVCPLLPYLTAFMVKKDQELIIRTQTIKRRSTRLKLSVRPLLDLGHGDLIGIGSLCLVPPSPRRLSSRTFCMSLHLPHLSLSTFHFWRLVRRE